jgi:hypothetical protein
MYLLTA